MRSRSLAHELRYGKGQSWAIAIPAIIGGIAAHRKAQNDDKTRKDQKEIALKKLKQDKNLEQQARIEASKGAQMSTSSVVEPTPQAEPFSKTYLMIALIGVAISIVALK